MTAPVLAHPPTLADRVVGALRDEIRARRLVPGELYSVQQVAELLGVSRSPAREGLLKLAEAGLVRFTRNRGFRIVLPEPRDVAEIFAVRLALEPAAAARAASRGAVLTLEQLDDATHLGDEASFWEADRALHDAILRAGGNRRAAEIVAGLRATTALLTPPTSAGDRSLAAIRDEHAPVVAAVAAGDAAGAERAMREHLEHTGRLLVARVADRPVEDPAVERIWSEAVN
ncbi:GntR family transcriptional regulator [Spongisporangium articulatum]|uniref:GntR family transcriptional regulator n=1 Tax=Spongisporangium articulatum TaxID=3362603 RepID=A0ABW8AU36_9ACTN